MEAAAASQLPPLPKKAVFPLGPVSDAPWKTIPSALRARHQRFPESSRLPRRRGSHPLDAAAGPSAATPAACESHASLDAGEAPGITLTAAAVGSGGAQP